MILLPVRVAIASYRKGNQSQVPAHASFESLPFDIWYHVLSLLDLQQLRALVHASPAFHQRYLQRRSHFLKKSLETSLNEAFIDADVVSVVNNTHWASQYSNASLVYEDWRAWASESLRTSKSTRIEVFDTATFFIYFVVPLLRSYAAYRKKHGETTLSRCSELLVIDEQDQRQFDETGLQLQLDHFEDDLHYFLLAFET